MKQNTTGKLNNRIQNFLKMESTKQKAEMESIRLKKKKTQSELECEIPRSTYYKNGNY